MSTNSNIEWTSATWNPLTGCTKVSPGCAHCFIERTPPFRMAGRRFVNGRIPVLLHPERLTQPLHWRKPRRVFVNSLSDLFHEDVPDEYIARVYGVMVASYWHTFQVLTKRPERRRELLNRPDFREAVAGWAARMINGLHSPRRGTYPSRSYVATLNLAAWNAGAAPNIWEGVSTENQRWANIRVPELLETPAAVRFVSCEPLLGPVDISQWLHDSTCVRNEEIPFCICSEPREDHVNWVIGGGESGPKARPMRLSWARSLRDQCQAAGVAFFMKQYGRVPLDDLYRGEDGAVWPTGDFQRVYTKDSHGGDWSEWAEEDRVREMPR